MEDELEIKSSLMAPPKKDTLSLANAQLGFMNMFATPLFQGVADILPAMQYTVEELEINKGLFELKVQEEKAKQSTGELLSRRGIREGTFSPKTRSVVGDSVADDVAAPSDKQEQTESMMDGTVEKKGDTPQVYADVVKHDSQHIPTAADDVGGHSSPASQRASKPQAGGGMNGTTSSFDAVRELADSDPFNTRSRGDSSAEGKGTTTYRQRCSETTEGSTSGTFAGDWQSQATTTTTGKMALSPSTQGTSIVSNESVERTVSGTGFNMSPPSTSSHGSPGTVLRDGGPPYEEGTPGGSIGKAEGKSLKKRPSRFRMKDFPFFRRNKAASPPLPASDTTGQSSIT